MSTGLNRVAFSKAWFAGKQTLRAIGTASDGPVHQINIDQFQVGEKLTYTLRP